MELSIFLAKALGLYFLIVSLAAFTNIDKIKGIINGILQNASLHFVLALNILVIGILLVLSHNRWEISWPIIITIVSWLIFLKGFINLVFPEWVKVRAKPFMKRKSRYYVAMAINFLIGVILSYYGFWVGK